MDEDRLSSLWRAMNQARPLSTSFFDLLRFAREQNVTLSFDDLRELSKRARLRDGFQVLCPGALVDFIIGYLAGYELESILDPWAGIGSLLIPVVTVLQPKTSLGICRNEADIKEAEAFDKNRSVSWVSADPHTYLDGIRQAFDAIVSCPVWGGRPTRVEYELKGHKVKINDDLGNHLILKSCLHLSENGVGLFTVPLSFITSYRTKSVFNNLSRFGLKTEAFISLPTGFFIPYTAVRSALTVIRRGTSDNIFVGEISDDAARNKLLLSNLKTCKNGKELALGKVLPVKDFKEYNTLAAEERVARMARRISLIPVAFSAVVSGFRFALPSRHSEEAQEFEEQTNAVYLPLIGHSDAVTSLSELTMKHHNYVQLLIDPEKANPRYVVAFFNSPLGQMVRESACSGTTIPRITQTSLQQMLFFLPDLRNQVNALDADSRINSLVTELRELHERIWSNPGELADIAKEIERVNKEERFSDWLDNLPFPLASILWAYHAATDNRRKQYEYLDHFFEALAQLIATLLLSGFVTDSELFTEERPKLLEVLSKHNLSFERSTFGTWVKVAERLAKRARTFLNGPEDNRKRCQELFRTNDTGVLQAILSSKLIGLLQETNALRNDWRGHGGVAGDRTIHERHMTLNNYLMQARECFGGIWSRYQFVLPQKMRFAEGSYSTTVYRLTGSRTPFESIELQLAEPLEDRHLYVLGEEERRALKLLPFMKIMASPEHAQTACYFYNRKEEEGFRYISHHFEAEAEIIESFKDTDEAISLILSHGEV